MNIFIKYSNEILEVSIGRKSPLIASTWHSQKLPACFKTGMHPSRAGEIPNVCSLHTYLNNLENIIFAGESWKNRSGHHL